MFNETVNDPALEARVAELEAQLATLAGLVTANATDAQALVEALALTREAGDAAAQASVTAERNGRVEVVRQVNDLVGDLAVRVEQGDRINTKTIEQKAVLAGYALSVVQQAVDQAWLAVARTLVAGPFKTQAEGESVTSVGKIFHVLGPGNNYATPYERTAGGSVVAGQPIASPASVAAVLPSAMAALAATRRVVPSAQANHLDRTGGAATEELQRDRADAFSRFVGTPPRGSFELLDRIDQVDTLARRITQWYAQSFVGDVDIAASARLAGKVVLGGSDPQQEVIERELWTDLLRFWEVRGRNGRLISFDGQNDRILMGAAGAIAPVDGALWQHPDGTLRVNRRPGYYTGRHSYQSQTVPPPQCILAPSVVYPDENPSITWPTPNNPDTTTTYSFLGPRQFILIPSICGRPSREFYAWCADAARAEEGAGNFIILAYSDDGGVTKTEFAYVRHPEQNLGRTMMPQLWLDQFGHLQMVFSMNYAFAGIAGGDDRHGAWNMPILGEMGPRPRCGRAWQIAPYGIPGRPVWVDDRFLVNVDLVENPTSGLPAPGPISAWRGKAIFEINTATRSAVKVGFIANSAAFASYQECSTIQLRNGQLMTMYRTRDSLHIARSLTGDPADFGAPEQWTALPRPNYQQRAALVMSSGGRPLVAWNNHPSTRLNPTLGLLDDTGSSLIRSIPLEPAGAPWPQSTSYFSIWCEGDAIKIIFDHGRSGAKQIIKAQLSEAAFVAGTAVPSFTIIEDQ